jgi:hypothetical protein
MLWRLDFASLHFAPPHIFFFFRGAFCGRKSSAGKRIASHFAPGVGRYSAPVGRFAMLPCGLLPRPGSAQHERGEREDARRLRCELPKTN